MSDSQLRSINIVNASDMRYFFLLIMMQTSLSHPVTPVFWVNRDKLVAFCSSLNLIAVILRLSVDCSYFNLSTAKTTDSATFFCHILRRR